MNEDDTTTSVDDSLLQADDNSSQLAAEDDNNEEAGSQNEETASTQDDSTEAGSQGEQPTEEEDIKEWATSKGLPLDDPIKIAKIYRDAERKLHTQSQKASELSKKVQEIEPDDDGYGNQDVETTRLLNKLAVTDFYLNNPEARAYDAKMAEILQEKPHLRDDLETLYTVARSRTSDQELHEARQTGKKEALKSVSHSQKTAAPKANATTRDSGRKKWTDEAVADLSSEEYDANRDEILADLGLR